MASSPPVISAPTLVTSTNPATTTSKFNGSQANTQTPPSTPQKDDDWHFKYLEAKSNYRKLKAQMREQAKKSRQLIVAVKNKLQEEEKEKSQVKNHYEQELNGLCQQLLGLRASMLREQGKLESVLKEKDALISKQREEIEKLMCLEIKSPLNHHAPVSVTSLSGLSPVALGGSLRIHGSFRQYKKDREKIRQHLKSTTTLNSSDSSSGININSSEESSSSPSTLPRTQKVVGALLRPMSLDDMEPMSKKKGILKPSPDKEPVVKTLTNLDHLIDPATAAEKNIATSTRIRITNAEDTKSDSGRESDDIEQMPNVSVVTVSPAAASTKPVSSDSANSSFDGSDPTLAWKISVKNEVLSSSPGGGGAGKKVKPPPPPRSSQTRLSTIKPKSILSPTSSLNNEMSPTEALDNLIRNGDQAKLRQSKKRVKFNPRIDTKEEVKGAVVGKTEPLDPEFLHFLPRLTAKQEAAKKSDIVASSGGGGSNFSYYEPYI